MDQVFHIRMMNNLSFLFLGLMCITLVTGMCEGMYMWAEVPREARGNGTPQTGVTGGFKQSDVGMGN